MGEIANNFIMRIKESMERLLCFSEPKPKPERTKTAPFLWIKGAVLIDLKDDMLEFSMLLRALVGPFNSQAHIVFSVAHNYYEC